MLNEDIYGTRFLINWKKNIDINVTTQHRQKNILLSVSKKQKFSAPTF